jgi:hypothetical protein
MPLLFEDTRIEGGEAMDFVGIDLHKTSSRVCILSEDGELTEFRIKSTRASFDEMFAGKPPARASWSRPRPRANGSPATSNGWATR